MPEELLKTQCYISPSTGDHITEFMFETYIVRKNHTKDTCIAIFRP